MRTTSRPPSPPSSIAVVGAGTMGTGIAVAFALGGTRAVLVARREATLERARRRLDEGLAVLLRHDLVSQAAADGARRGITMTTDLETLAGGVELVIESIAEEVEAKTRLLRDIERQVSARTIIATNTSSLSLAALSSAIKRSRRFAGYHWFNPPELVQLVEIVTGQDTSPGTTQRLVDWSAAIGKEPVVLRHEIDGYVANRLQYALLREAYALVEAGVCGLDDVDRVMTAGLGPRWAAVGPFASMDLAGLDVHIEVVRRLFPLLSSKTAVPAVLERLISKGAKGAKTGHGLKGDYDDEALERLTERRAGVVAQVGRLQRVDAPELAGPRTRRERSTIG